MSGVNKVILIGNLGADPELVETRNGPRATFNLATSESWSDKESGERRERTEWHRCKVWGRQAEVVQQFVRKGSKLYVEGKLETSSYEKNGETRHSTEVRVQNFQMLDSKGGGQGGGGWDERPRQQPRQQTAAAAMPDDDDIPF